MERSKKTVMIVLCAAIFLMAVGFAAFSTTLTIDGTANVSSDWNVVFTDIEVVSKTDGATSKSAEASGTTATFDVGLINPGDNIVYVITVENQGTLDAIIENITATASDNPAIDFAISNIKIGDTLAKQTSTTFNVTISYDKDVTSQPSKISSALTVGITYVQNLGQDITPSSPTIQLPLTLGQKLESQIADARSDANINFAKPVNNTTGKGMYYTNERTQDNKTVYYYRGNVENNYVKFGTEIKNMCLYNNQIVRYTTTGWWVGAITDLTAEECTSTNVCQLSGNNKFIVGVDSETCELRGGTLLDEKAVYQENVTRDIYWRIVRVNEDGSIRLITQDIVGTSKFNNDHSDNADVGYMYGTIRATGDNAYELTHTNTHDSVLKDYLDDWYENKTNLPEYNNLMSITAGFCNDRSVAPQAELWSPSDTALGYGQKDTYYGTSNRLVNLNNGSWPAKSKELQFACPNEERDLFTVTKSSVGNAKLTNPVGMLTADEVVYAGAYRGGITPNIYYLDNDKHWWTISPLYNALYTPTMWLAYSDGQVEKGSVEDNYGVRPVINITSNAPVIRGTGTATDPFVIQ